MPPGWWRSTSIPGRRLRSAGVATWIIAIALVVAVVGLFVVPVVGAPGRPSWPPSTCLNWSGAASTGGAWTATKQALRAVGLSIGIELLTAMAMITTWGIGVWARVH